MIVTVPDAWRGGDLPLKLRVKVTYGRGESLDVWADGRPVVAIPTLFAPIDTTGCSWTVEGSDTIIVTMEKRDAREWHTLFLAATA